MLCMHANEDEDEEFLPQSSGQSSKVKQFLLWLLMLFVTPVLCFAIVVLGWVVLAAINGTLWRRLFMGNHPEGYIRYLKSFLGWGAAIGAVHGFFFGVSFLINPKGRDWMWMPGSDHHGVGYWRPKRDDEM